MVEAYIDPAADFLLLDGLEPVTVEFVRSNSTHSVEVASAMSSPVDLSNDNFSDVSIGSESKSWSMTVASLDGETLQKGDLIVDASGNAWRVDGVVLRSFDTIYRAICNRIRRNVSA